MNEVVDIDNVIDKAIIKSLEYIRDKHRTKGLLAGAIKDTIKDRYSIDDSEAIQSRIRELHKRGILIEIKPSRPRKDTKRVYALNIIIEFNYICGLLPTEVGSKEVPAEIRRQHTEKLQDAIRTWIEFFPEPNSRYPFDNLDRYQDHVKKCQSHSLFPDLENHLPEMEYGVWKEWRRYKEDLLKLQKMKEQLLSIIKNEIAKCFIGFKLRFIPDLEYGINYYDCHLLHKILYDLVLDMSGRISDEEAYNNYERCIGEFKFNTTIFDGTSTYWRIRGADELIMVPRDKREALTEGIERFLDLLNNIEKPHIIKPVNDIIKKVDELKRDKEKMMEELEDTLNYYCFSGECKYLAGF